MFNEKIITAFYATNDNYAPYMGVSLYSLIANTNPSNKYKIFILQKNLSKYHKDRLLKLSTKNVEIEILDVGSLMQGKKIPTIGHLSEEATYRILVDKLLVNCEKVLYIDCDTIINKDIAELYKEDVSEYVAGVVYDNLPEPLAERINEVIDVPLDTYFNSGIMLINIPMFRHHNIGNKCFELLDLGITYPTLDQDVLNVTCRGLVKFLDGRWNAKWACLIDEGIKYLRDEQRKDLDEPFIVHYVARKPWANPSFPMAEYFWNYAKKTCFYEEILFANTKSSVKATNPFQRFVFPWNCVDVGSKIIVYGAGVVGRAFVKQIEYSQYCKIVAICDKNYDKISDLSIPVISINDIELYDFDKIVIAIENNEIAEKICNELLAFGIDKFKLVWKDYKRL